MTKDQIRFVCDYAAGLTAFSRSFSDAHCVEEPKFLSDIGIARVHRALEMFDGLDLREPANFIRAYMAVTPMKSKKKKLAALNRRLQTAER